MKDEAKLALLILNSLDCQASIQYARGSLKSGEQENMIISTKLSFYYTIINANNALNDKIKYTCLH